MVTGYECEPPIDPSLDVVNVVDKPSPQSMVTVHGASWSGSLKPAPLSENNAPTSTVWSPPAVTTGGWLGGGGVGQLTEKDAVPVPPAGTFTVCDVPPLTVQFAAIPDKTTV